MPDGYSELIKVDMTRQSSKEFFIFPYSSLRAKYEVGETQEIQEEVNRDQRSTSANTEGEVTFNKHPFRAAPSSQARVHAECDSCQAVNGVLPADGSRCEGHGTHVASTVGGLKYGVAKNVTIVPVFSCFGFTCSDGSVPTLTLTPILTPIPSPYT